MGKAPAGTKKGSKKAAKAKKEGPKAAKELPERPAPSEIRRARKAQLVAWCEALGLNSEGKVDELRARLIEFVETPKEEAVSAEKAEEKEPIEAEAPKAEVALEPKAEKRAAREKKEEEVEAGAEEALHVARRKPTLDERTRRLLRLRAEIASRRPAFRRQEWFRYQRLGVKWRKPQGGQSKLRRHMGYRWNVPSIGFRSPKAIRGLHPSGFEEVLVHNVQELEGIDPARQAVRVAHGVGTRKRELIEEACEEREIRVLNRMVTR